MAEEWDAAVYDRVADPQTGWGLRVLDRLTLAGDERVMDAGCGTGRVTEALLARLPRGRVIALDASRRMLAVAGSRLDMGRAHPVCADLLSVPVRDGSLDAVFSTATFHWVLDHDRLFDEMARVLRPGGMLVAQCGGHGNVARFIAAAKAVDPRWDERVTFATPEETLSRLDASGFAGAQAWLEAAPARFEPGSPLEEFVATVCARRHLERIPESERAPFVRAVARRLPEPIIDYVRLNIVARRA